MVCPPSCICSHPSSSTTLSLTWTYGSESKKCSQRSFLCTSDRTAKGLTWYNTASWHKVTTKWAKIGHIAAIVGTIVGTGIIDAATGGLATGVTLSTDVSVDGVLAGTDVGEDAVSSVADSSVSDDTAAADTTGSEEDGPEVTSDDLRKWLNADVKMGADNDDPEGDWGGTNDDGEATTTIDKVTEMIKAMEDRIARSRNIPAVDQ